LIERRPIEGRWLTHRRGERGLHATPLDSEAERAQAKFTAPGKIGRVMAKKIRGTTEHGDVSLLLRRRPVGLRLSRSIVTAFRLVRRNRHSPQKRRAHRALLRAAANCIASRASDASESAGSRSVSRVSTTV